ncbi:MAG: AraC family transcriptional regulator [Tannerellaceae bacterium]|nr:AraC family transcriptional regulator [Tannerellaceae bacterium]
MTNTLSQESRVFQYGDVFFGCYFNNDESCTKMMKDHTLIYLYSGEITIYEDDKATIVYPGDCVFVRRDNRIDIFKKPKDGKQFKSVFMTFTRSFLREFHKSIDKRQISQINKSGQSVVKLPDSPDIASLFQSLTPYFDTHYQPSGELIKLKQQEGIYSLLNIDPNFHAILFDFADPWKIDILDFLEANYMYDLSMEDIANFTGRSLATFKRDFKKISDLTPYKWIMQKRLQAAHDKIKHEKKKVSDVYLEVGFKDLSHFSKAYKDNFGYSPTK